MQLPKYVENSFIERIGVNKVASVLSEMKFIFRETSNSDVGIDGQIEEIDENYNATGRIMAVQIKSGKSYLRDNRETWIFNIDEAHRNYWSLFPIPVILLVHNTNDNQIYFIDVKYALNTTDKIEIPKKNILCSKNKEEFLKTIGGSISHYSEVEEVFDFMLNKRNDDPSFAISYLELFTSGLTNLCRDVFFDVSIAMDIADIKSNGIGVSVYDDFLWEYIRYLVKENLAEINFHSCLYDYEERHLLPRFIAPLTYRGRQLLQYISLLENKFLDKSIVSIVSESYIYLQFDRCSVDRLYRLSELQTSFIKDGK